MLGLAAAAPLPELAEIIPVETVADDPEPAEGAPDNDEPDVDVADELPADVLVPDVAALPVEVLVPEVDELALPEVPVQEGME